MNTNTMELNLNEMAMVAGGETGDVMERAGLRNRNVRRSSRLRRGRRSCRS